MTGVRKRYPDRAVQRAAGMGDGHSNEANNRSQTYATYGDLQTRYVSRRFGLSYGRARIVAGLAFGEASR